MSFDSQRPPPHSETPSQPQGGGVPPTLSPQERDAIIEKVLEEHGDFLDDLVVRAAGFVPESRKDLRQRVLMALTAHVEQHGAAPRNVRGYFTGVVKNDACNHGRLSRLRVKEGADASALISPGLDPERAAELTEKQRNLERDLLSLPDEEAEAFRCISLFGLSMDEAAAACGRPRSTVDDQNERAVKKLEALEAAREKATMRGPRKPRPAR